MIYTVVIISILVMGDSGSYQEAWTSKVLFLTRCFSSHQSYLSWIYMNINFAYPPVWIVEEAIVCTILCCTFTREKGVVDLVTRCNWSLSCMKCLFVWQLTLWRRYKFTLQLYLFHSSVELEAVFNVAFFVEHSGVHLSGVLGFSVWSGWGLRWYIGMVACSGWYGGFLKWWYPKMDGLWRKTLLKWMICGITILGNIHIVDVDYLKDSLSTWYFIFQTYQTSCWKKLQSWNCFEFFFSNHSPLKNFTDVWYIVCIYIYIYMYIFICVWKLGDPPKKQCLQMVQINNW